MQDKVDFFFQKAKKHKSSKEFDLREMTVFARRYQTGFFTAQLNRYLKNHDSLMSVTHATSCPPFIGLLEKIDPDSIGMIEIYTRTDLNDSLKATLACNIILEQGIVSIATQWCAYKSERASELVHTLLVPLYIMGHREKTYLCWDDGLIEPLSQGKGTDYVEQLKSVFKLAQYPYPASLEEERKFYKENALSLQIAADIPSMRVESDTAQEALIDRFHRLKQEWKAGESKT